MGRPRLRSRLGRLAATLVVVVPAVTVVVTAAEVPGVVGAACTMCAGGEYHPLGAPVRIFDTRPATAAEPNLPVNDVAPLGAKPINTLTATTGVQRFDVQLLGDGVTGFENPWMADTMSSSDVLAVMVSVVVVTPGTKGRIRAWATGTPSATSGTILNFSTAQTVVNQSIVRPGTGGNLTFEMRGTTASTAHLAVDVVGWYSTSSYRGPDGIESTDERGGRTMTVTPGRIYDTGGGTVGPGSVTTVKVRGAMTIGASSRLIVPDSASVTAVVLDVTASLPTANTVVSAQPAMPASGWASTPNVVVPAGAVRSSTVVVPIAADGGIRLYNDSGNVRLVVDVLGYIDERFDELRVGRVVPLTSTFRAFDTRLTAFGNVPLGPGQREEWSFAAFAASVNVSSVSVGNQGGFIGNLTNASLVRQYPTVPVRSYLRVFPSTDSTTMPVATHISAPEGVVVTNMTLTTYGATSKVWVYNAAGYAHYVLDVSAVILSD